VQGLLILELKAVDVLLPIFTAQLLSYLRMAELKLGLLINFNSERLKDGVRRVVNNL
jgi:GxxExxY protein